MGTLAVRAARGEHVRVAVRSPLTPRWWVFAAVVPNIAWCCNWVMMELLTLACGSDKRF